jgi:hypothetical protein
MSEERPNEFSGWKGRLDQAAPGPEYFPADKEAAWDKLYDRLHGARGRKGAFAGRKPVLFWIAAACLLVALTTVLFWSGKKNAVPANLSPAFSPVRSGAVAGKEASSDNMLTDRRHFRTASRQVDAPARRGSAGQQNHLVGRKPAARPFQIKVLTIPAGDLSPITREVTREDPSPPPVNAQSSRINKADKETVTVPSILNTVKKEWRVVHINELGNPASASQSMTNNREYRAMHIHFGNGENLPDPTPEVPTIGSSPDNSLLKIRLSPANH